VWFLEYQEDRESMSNSRRWVSLGLWEALYASRSVMRTGEVVSCSVTWKKS